MKTLLFQQIFVLFFSLNAFPQLNPLRIDLISKDNKLNAQFYPSEQGGLKATIMLLHGVPGNNSSPLGMAEDLQKAGMNVLTFNYQGTFNSEGIFNYENCMDDILSALTFLKQEKNIRQFAIDTFKIIICGFSHGGSFVLTAALNNPEIQNIISIAGSDQSVFIRKLASDTNYRTVYERRVASLFSPSGPIKCDSAYLHNYFNTLISKPDQYNLMKNAGKLKGRKILFIVGWQDTTSPMEEHVLPLYRSLKQMNPDNVFIQAFDVNHYTFGTAREKLINTIIEWTNN